MKLWRYGRPIEYLGQRYRLDGILGSGGMADVCLAWDEREQREAAVKILKSDDLDQETLNRFMKEAAQIASWQHPHILRVYENMQIELIDAAQGSVLFYIVMEYARGGDLQKRLTPGRPFPLSASFALFRQLCDAVQYAHEQGVIHRDLKPLNILFRRPAIGPEEVVLSDFGLAVQVDASHHTFARGGTLAYMAPEQFQGSAIPASDLFALGVILYQLCTGRLPFRRTLADLQRAGDAPIPTRPSLLNPDLPPGLDEPILRALRELPAERYRSAREFWDVIALALTTSAQTFPFGGAFENVAGETWPFDGSEQPLVYGHASRPDPLTPSRPLPVELAAPVEEGPDSELGSVREKQKAPPDGDSGLSLPTYSIPASPNPRRQFAPDPTQPRPIRFQSPQTGHQGADKQPRARDGKNRDRGELRLYTQVSQRQALARPAGAQDEVNDNISQTSTRSGTPTTRRHFDQPIQTGRSQYGDPSNQIPRRPAHPRPARRAGSGSLPPAHLDVEAEASSVSSPHRRDSVSISHQRGGSASVSTSRQRANPTSLHISKKHPRRLPLVPALTTLALLVLLAAIFAAAGIQGPLLRLFGAPTVTVTLVPRSQLEQATFALTAVHNTPDPAQSQIQVRHLTATSPTQSATANASGSIAAKRATGQLTFINNTANTITIQSTIITSTSGVQVSFNGPISIPANPPTIIVPGFAVHPGAAGNIPTLDISKACCAPNNEIFVKNTAFTGGQDAQPNSVIQQKDIDGAANPLVETLRQGAQNSLQGQVTSNERAVDSTLQCPPAITADHRAGDIAKTVTVQVAVTCSEEVYDYAAARQIARQSLQARAASNPNLGGSFTLSGQVALNVLGITPGAGNTFDSFTLNVQARGLWVYAFSPSRLRQLAGQIAGKSSTDARAMLLQQMGIADAQFSVPGNLPGNVDEIQVVVKQLPAPA